MPNEPKIKIEDLPKDDQELPEDELEGVAGGMKRHVGQPKYGNVTMSLASDPDSGDEVV